MNTSAYIGHPDCRRTDLNRHLLGIGHRDNGCVGRLIFFGCHCGNGRHPGGSHRHGAADLVIAVTHYLDFGRIPGRLDESRYS